jgi:hypothetical protein
MASRVGLLALLLLLIHAMDLRAQIVAPPIVLDVAPSTPATYEQRRASMAARERPNIDSLVLPLASARGFGPQRVAAGTSFLTRLSRAIGMRDVVWQAVPWTNRHGDFLARFSAATNDEARSNLVRWCDEQELPECSEYVLRRWLVDHPRDFHTSVYQRQLADWRRYGGERRSPFTFRLPVRGQWFVLVDTSRHHQQKHWSAWAYDLVMLHEGVLHTGKNEAANHYAWRQPVYAVSDGVIVSVEDRFADQEIGRRATLDESNFIQLDCGGVYAFYGHVQQGSARVKRGDRVKQGDVLALVGNSGSSHAPHLHFTMIDGDGFSIHGRYRFQVWTSAGWHEVDGIDLAEGWYVKDEG